MIRGTIELVATDCVVGWVHSEAASVRDKMVLAFVGDHCVGSGKVNVYRRDLDEAGLGDGHIGFHFGITLPDTQSLDRVVVRFEGSDFSLLQKRQTVGKASTAGAVGKAEYSRLSINWLRDQGWIGQVEFDFLHQLTTLGLYDRSLRVSNLELLDPTSEAKRLFELFYQAPVAIEKDEVPIAELASATVRRNPELLTIAAVHIADGALAILEGSHNEPLRDQALSSAGSVRHLLRHDRLLFVDTRASFICEGSGTALLFRGRSLATPRPSAKRGF